MVEAQIFFVLSMMLLFAIIGYVISRKIKLPATVIIIALGIVSVHIKKYLREKYGNKCVLCSWAQVNIVTEQVPLVADHIDGNWRNNIEDNLRLVCPNCDATSSTYAALNK